MNPFVGLRPFREDERHLFMGRELAGSYVETKSALNPLTLLFARSGIGKSSFLTSRVIPKLRNDHSIALVNEWGGQRPETIVRERLDRLESTPKEPNRCAYLVLDQFEDVFKQDLVRRELWEIFADIANTGQTGTRLIVSMREEWLGAWEEVQQYIPNTYDSIVRLAPLTQKELRRAIVGPIEAEGTMRIDQGLVEIVLKDLRQPNAFGLGEGFVEPGLLQLVCQRLWEEAAKSSHLIDQNLYDSLGGADAIIRDFVWRHLRDDSPTKGVFKSDQRVLWAGLVRHLSVTQGVKAILTPDMLARNLRMADLGIAGPAVAAGKGLALHNYLSKPVERRGASPQILTDWITETLEVARSFGFLKRQEGYKANNPRARLYELSHDGLDDIFRSFSLEFEKWATRRVLTLLAFVYVILFGMPYFTLTALTEGMWAAIGRFLVFVVFGAIYLGILWIMLKLYVYIAVVIYYPFVRRLVRGTIKSGGKKPRRDQV